MLIGAGIGIPFQQNVLARLLGSAEFFAPLTHSAIPTRAAFGTTGTFTRATTSTWPNNDGYMVTGVAGEIGFVGARRVRNYFVNTEALSSANWVLAGSLVAAPTRNDSQTDPNGGTTAIRLNFPAVSAANSYSIWYQAIGSSLISSKTALNSVYLKGVSGGEQLYLMWTADGVNYVRTLVTLTTSWVRYSLAGATTAGATQYFQLGVDLRDGSQSAKGIQSIYVAFPQLEDVTAQTTKTAGEYVSVGVESAPYYHGSFVDGVKCYATDINGSPIPSSTLLGYSAEGARTNLCLQSNAFTTTWINATITPVQNVVGPDGATSAWTLEDNSAIAFESIGMSGITLTAAAYTLSIYIKKTSGSTKFPVLQVYSPTGLGYSFCTCDTNNGVATIWTSNAYGTTLASGSARCSSFNADFWRFEMTFTGTALTDYVIVLYPTATANATQASGSLDATLTGTNVFYGCMLELGSFASSYIATTTIAVARNADVLTYPSAGNIDGTVGWCYAEVAIPTLSGQTQLIAGASVNSAAMYISSDTKVSIYDNTAERKGAAFTASSSVGKLVTTWGGSESKTAFNGTASAALGFDGDLNYSGNLQIGAYAGASAALPMFGTIRNVRIGQRQLSASELQAITA